MNVQSSLCARGQSEKYGLPCIPHFFYVIFSLLLFASYANSATLSIDKIILQAKSQNKHIMFFHHIPGCPYCKRMLEENFKDAKLLQEVEDNFIYVEIYTANDGEIVFKDFKGSYKEFSKHIGAFAYPATIFMDVSGKIVHKAVGYRNIDEHLADIAYVATQSYKSMDLDAYKTQRELEEF